MDLKKLRSDVKRLRRRSQELDRVTERMLKNIEIAEEENKRAGEQGSEGFLVEGETVRHPAGAMPQWMHPMQIVSLYVNGSKVEPWARPARTVGWEFGGVHFSCWELEDNDGRYPCLFADSTIPDQGYRWVGTNAMGTVSMFRNKPEFRGSKSGETPVWSTITDKQATGRPAPAHYGRFHVPWVDSLVYLPRLEEILEADSGRG